MSEEQRPPTQAVVPVKPPVEMGEGGLTLKSIEDAYRWGQCVISSGFAPKGITKPEQVVVAVQTGAELGFSPMQALANIPVINGRPGLMGDAAKALVRSRGVLEPGTDIIVKYSGTGDSYGCEVTAHRRGYAEPVSSWFDVAAAKRARLWGKPGPWTDYSDRMLMYRAWGFLARDLFSDVLMGLYIMEEVRDFPTPEPVEALPPAGPDPLLIEDGD